STSALTSINTLLNETKSLRMSTGYGTANLVPALIRSLSPSSEPSGQWQDVNQRASFVTYSGGEHAEPQR
ncbi:hypothetical protein Rin_00013970, partial [Candidatus Regiella insecticola 5.15]